MSAQRLTMLGAGLMLLASLFLADYYGQIVLISVSWLWLSLFVGANLSIAGLTGLCLMTKMLKAVGAR